MKQKPTTTPGRIYLVGAGPGDPGLLTLRAKELLNRADVVYYDHLVNPEILVHCPQAEKHYVGKVGYEDSVSQATIVKNLLQAVKKHQHVLRLKGGDPFIFGRGGEEAEQLQAEGVGFEIVPGITSAIAVAAYAGIPLTHRELSSTVTLVTGHEDPQKMEKEGSSQGINWKALAGEKTLVFLMGVKSLQGNLGKLVEHGMSPSIPAAIIEWGTYPYQRTLVGTVETLPQRAAQAEFKAPSVVVVGEVVQFRKQLQWFEQRPLFGKKVLVTRSRQQSGLLSQSLREFGAWTIELPTIELKPPQDWGPLDQAIEKITQYQWVLFSSVNTVEFFFGRLKELQKDVRSLHGAKIAAVGPATSQALRQRGIQVDRQPEEFTTDALAESFSRDELAGIRILFPRAQVARQEIVDHLSSRGAEVQVVSAYRVEKPHYDSSHLKLIFQETVPDLLTFASSSMVTHFHDLLSGSSTLDIALKIPAIVIGPVTGERAKQLGFNVAATAEEYTIPGMVETVLGYFAK